MKYIFLVAYGLFLMSCNNESHQEGKLLSRDKVVSVLCDVHILEVKMARLKLDADSTRKIYNTFEQDIFEKHGVTKKAYEHTIANFMEEPKRMEKVYEIVIDSLNVREQKASMLVEKEKEEEKARKKKLEAEMDSLNTAELDSLIVPDSDEDENL